MAKASMQAAMDLVAEYISSSSNPDLRIYGSKVLRAIADGRHDRYVWRIREACRLTRSSGGTLLDIGCGFGWDTLALSVMSGSRQVIGNDIRSSMTGPIEEFVKLKEAEGVTLPITFLTGDICDVELPRGSIDAVICNQTIEHVHDLDRMFSRVGDLVRVGGRVVLTNDNNALNRRSLREVESMWRLRDGDPAYIEKLKQERPIENADIEPYAQTRRRLILNSEASPSLSKSDVELIVEATAGLTRSEIEAAASKYVETATLPAPDRLGWCRDPLTGEYCERQLDPFDIADRLNSFGFRTTVRHGFRKQPLHLLNGVGIRWINTLLFQLRPFFIVVGERC